MLTFGSFRRTGSILVNLAECIFRRPSYRAISSTCLNMKYRYLPTVNDPSKDLELSEPGRDDEDETITLFPTKKQQAEYLANVKSEFETWKHEWKDELQDNFDTLFPENVIHKLYSFTEEGTLEKWTSFCDSQEGLGFSSCSLTRSSSGYALFSGNLSTKLPQDGKTVRSGFCAALGPRAMLSFNRKTRYEWSQYTHVVFKVRGDGRNYLINISTEGEFDINWYNLYTYPLYTRGGPYWQLTKIPFSKFIFGSRGYIQDYQVPIPLDDVAWIGVALYDDIDGPFSLEMDYIGLEISTAHDEEHAYEAYNFDNYFYKE